MCWVPNVKRDSVKLKAPPLSNYASAVIILPTCWIDGVIFKGISELIKAEVD